MTTRPEQLARRRQINVTRDAEVAAQEYAATRTAEVLRNRSTRISDLDWFEAVLAGAYEDGYKAAAS